MSGGVVSILGVCAFVTGLADSWLFRHRHPNPERESGVHDLGLRRFGVRTSVQATLVLLVAGVGLLIAAPSLAAEDQVAVSTLPPRDLVISGGLPSLVALVLGLLALFGSGAAAGATYDWLLRSK